MQSKHQVSVMVSEGESDMYLIGAGLKMNTLEYLKVLEEIFLP